MGVKSMTAVPKTNLYTEDDYYELPEHVRAELIDGQFYDMAPPGRRHQEILTALLKIIAVYIDSKHGSCHVYPASFAVKLFDDGQNIVEPDISVICDLGKLTDQGCTGAPDWVIEIVSPGNPSHDYVRKLNLYMDADVREYWIVDPRKQTVLVYNFKENHFDDMQHYTFQDQVKVGIYDDFSIDFSAI